MKSTMRRAVAHGLYPLLLGSTLLLVWFAVRCGWDLRRALWAYLAALLLGLALLEAALPLSPGWSITRRSFARDLKYLVIDGAVIAAVRTAFGALSIALAERHGGLLSGAPLVLAVPAYLLLFELLQYGYHRLSHERTGAAGRFLWRVHLAHHLPDRVYVVMHGVFHPLGAAFMTALVQAPMLLLGLSPQAAFAATLLIDLQTILSHLNVDVRAGLLNRLFIGTELHRYHHSADVAEAKNYGSVLSVWDQVFGTFHLRPEPPRRLGVADAERLPPSEDLLAVAAYPFRREQAAR